MWSFLTKGSKPRLCMWRVVGLNDSEGVMDVGSGGNIPGVTGQGACAETAHVIAKVSDDRFDELLGKTRGRG